MAAVVVYSSTVLYYFVISTFICVPCVQGCDKYMSILHDYQQHSCRDQLCGHTTGSSSQCCCILLTNVIVVIRKVAVTAALVNGFIVMALTTGLSVAGNCAVYLLLLLLLCSV